jgi:hypothetical protein
MEGGFHYYYGAKSYIGLSLCDTIYIANICLSIYINHNALEMGHFCYSSHKAFIDLLYCYK